MRDATLCFLIRGDPPNEVLLGLKRVGFGAGKYTGFGGKIQAGETIPAAAVRELAEEAGVWVFERDLQPMGQLTFLFPAKPAWSQVVHVFLAARWTGRVVKSKEMKPVWFAVRDLPFEEMWQDGFHWLPRILAGERIRARFSFREDNETIDKVELEAWGGDSHVNSGL